MKIRIKISRVNCERINERKNIEERERESVREKRIEKDEKQTFRSKDHYNT